MAYNIMDIIYKGIDVATKRRSVFEKIEQENPNNLQIKIVSRVLIKEVNRTILYYGDLLNKYKGADFEEINILIYDKISFLINSFDKKIFIPKISTVREYIRYSIDINKDLYSLLIDIQGRLVLNTSDTGTITYIILTDIINYTSKHIDLLENIMRQYLN